MTRINIGLEAIGQYDSGNIAISTMLAIPAITVLCVLCIVACMAIVDHSEAMTAGIRRMLTIGKNVLGMIRINVVAECHYTKRAIVAICKAMLDAYRPIPTSPLYSVPSIISMPRSDRLELERQARLKRALARKASLARKIERMQAMPSSRAFLTMG